MVAVNTYGNVDVVVVNGRIDSSNASELDEALKGLTDNGRYKLVVDASQISYMSSAGLRALVSALKTCKKNNGNLHICQPSERVAEVLDLAGLTDLFEIFDDQTAAVGSYT
jgi:anti-sigma B factor antagonist